MDLLKLVIIITIGIITLVTFSAIVTVIKIRQHVNRMISCHNDIIHTLEEENRFLQNRLVSIPKEVLRSVEVMIIQNPDSAVKTIKYLIETDGVWSSDVFDNLVKERQKVCGNDNNE